MNTYKKHRGRGQPYCVSFTGGALRERRGASSQSRPPGTPRSRGLDTAVARHSRDGIEWLAPPGTAAAGVDRVSLLGNTRSEKNRLFRDVAARAASSLLLATAVAGLPLPSVRSLPGVLCA